MPDGDLIARGYEREPEEIHLAVRWLELNEPESAIGLPEVQAKIATTAAERTQEAAGKTTGKVLPEDGSVNPGNASQFANHTQTARAQQSGISKRQQEKLDALARKAPEKFAEVKAGTKSVHRACVEAGLVREPTPLALLRRAWGKASEEERASFAAGLTGDDLTALGLRRLDNL